jgi:iron complex outermembrane recepter protein
MPRILLLTSFVFLLPNLHAQSAGVRGTVQSATGSPLEGVVVRITGATATTDADGRYQVGGLSVGDAVVTATGGGYVPQERTVRVAADTVANFRLTPVYASVEVVESLREYHLEESALATRVNVRLLDVPQSVQVYPNQLIEDRAILEGNELFRNVSGLNQSTYSAMVFRGFTQREILFNGARGNAFGSLEGDVNNAGFSTSQIRLTNVQRVEVLKGPTSALYGSGEAGGLINYVTKQPKEMLEGQMQLRLGSYDQKYGSGDFSGPLTKKLLARGAYYFEDRDTFRNNSTARNTHGVAALVYKASEQHRLSAEAEYVGQTLGGQRLRGIPVTSAGAFLAPIEWSANEPTDRIRMIGRVLQLRSEHSFRNGWVVNVTFRLLGYENNDRSHESRGLNAANGASDVTMRREYRNFFRANDDWSLVGNATRTVKLANMRHQLLFGFEQFNQDHVFRNARAREVEVAGGQVGPLSILNPVYGRVDPMTYRLSPFTFTTADARRTGYYAQDQITVNRYVQALFSGRVDRYNDTGFAVAALAYKDTAMAGRVGLIVKPTAYFSIYGNLANSITRAPIFAQAPGANGPFGPETGMLQEIGAKTELANRRLMLTAAFFNISKSNVLRPDPLLGPTGANPNAVLAVGKARSRGFEFNAEGFLSTRLYTTFNYAFVGTEILKDNVASLVGKPLANAPRHTVGLFARYNVWRRTGVGFGMEGVSERIEPFAGIRADGYAIADVSLYHDFNTWSRVQLQVTNVADKVYATSSLFAARAGNIPGQPRAFIATITVNPFHH